MVTYYYFMMLKRKRKMLSHTFMKKYDDTSFSHLILNKKQK
jgi:hypothetical protein